MATKKPNIRSIRFSDELAQMIDLQPGKTFTEKFETLVTKCCWEIPGKEAELEKLNKEIMVKRKQLYAMMDQAGKLGSTINQLFPQVHRLEQSIAKEVHNWDL